MKTEIFSQEKCLAKPELHLSNESKIYMKYFHSPIYRKLKVFIILLLSSIHLFSQSLCRTDIMNGDKLIPANERTEFRNYDFSKLWLKTENGFVYGVIGNDNQRILIKILTVEKDNKNLDEYLVRGKSSVKGNICEFTGTITILQIQESVRSRFGVDDEFKDRSKTQGLLTAKYKFFENKNQKHSGVFEGELKTKWYLNKENQMAYDNINAHSDGFFNNAFVGTWKLYHSNLNKRCSWGDFRVPNIDCDFDTGVGEFNVSKKYWDKGWLDIALKNKSPNGAIVEVKTNKAKIEWWQ